MPPERDAAFRNPSLGPSLDKATRGDTGDLFELLGRLSGLPGPRPNMGLVAAFAAECASRGARADKLVSSMVRLDADVAAGGSKYEILPVCGVAALAARGVTDAKTLAVGPWVLASLHDAADDLRFRVREAVVAALVRLGEQQQDALVRALEPWMDGFFHAAAVLTALADSTFLNTLDDVDAVAARLDEAFALAKDAPRATSRYPGYKALVDALAIAPGAVAGRFGQPIFDLLATWSSTREPALRDAIAANVKSTRLGGRFAPDIDKVHAALDASAKVRRDPTTYVGETRGRGKKRR